MEALLFFNAVLILWIVVRQGMRQAHATTTVITLQARPLPKEKAPPIGASDPEVQAMLQDLGIDTEPLL